MDYVGNIFSAAAALIIAATSTAVADHAIPPHFKIKNLKIEGNKCTRSAFDEDFWSKGIRGEKSTVQSITRVCGTTRIKWNGLNVNINWIDDKERAFTDCERQENGHRCWITVPHH